MIAGVFTKRLIAFFLVLPLLVGCTSSDIVDYKRSPDGRLDVVVLRTGGGATTSFGYRVYIVPIGLDGSSGSLYRRNVVYHPYGTHKLEINWVGNQELQIVHGKTQIYDFKNTWRAKNPDDYPYEISITKRKKD